MNHFFYIYILALSIYPTLTMWNEAFLYIILFIYLTRYKGTFSMQVYLTCMWFPMGIIPWFYLIEFWFHNSLFTLKWIYPHLNIQILQFITKSKFSFTNPTFPLWIYIILYLIRIPSISLNKYNKYFHNEVFINFN